MSSTPQNLGERVSRFARIDRRALNETEVRVQFIDELFILLGWDVRNHRRRDVVHEDKVHGIGRRRLDHKAPDYGFYVGPPSEHTLRFYVEAKRPSVNLKDDSGPAYQLRRYAWSANLALSVLTDFEELAVYDARVRPRDTDSARVARTHYWRFEQYEEVWDEIHGLLSRDAVLAGSLDAYGDKPRRGAETIDQAFLGELVDFREGLAKDIIARNPGMSSRDLGRAVQLILDRVVFLRMAEDRGIEARYGALRDAVASDGAYGRLLSLFERADARYDSGLFHFRNERGHTAPVDTITPHLQVGDKILKRIIDRLYFPNPYAFDVVSSDILGSVYERFLGTTIRVTASGKRAKVEVKGEVRRQQGVYYTPAHIVSFIVRHTVGRLLRDLDPDRAEGFAVLDPACGSGSFLVQVYEYLLDWHLQRYVADDPDRHARRRPPRVRRDDAGEWRLTLAERKRVLRAHVYGVDLDEQAVEVTKLSLLLKLLEHTADELRQQQLIAERVLPDLGANIKRGNTLVGAEWFALQEDPDEQAMLRVCPMDFRSEFQAVFDRPRPGFDVVLGNPPYLKEYTSTEAFHDLRGTGMERYYQGKMDLWYLFACRSVDLLRRRGVHGFIATNNWPTQAGASKLRDKLLSETDLHLFFDFGPHQVFEQASIQTMVYVVQKTEQPNRARTRVFRLEERRVPRGELSRLLRDLEPCDRLTAMTCEVSAGPEPFTFVDSTDAALLEGLEAAGSLRLTTSEMTQGIVAPQESVIQRHLEARVEATVGEGIFILSEEEARASGVERALLRPLYTTDEVGPFWTLEQDRRWVLYIDSRLARQMKQYPAARAHLDRFRAVNTSHNAPYGLHRARDERFFRGPKIVALRKTERPVFSYSDFPCYVTQTFNVVCTERADLLFLTGLLSSSVLHYWFALRGKRQGELLQIDSGPLQRVPLLPGTDDVVVEAVGQLRRLYAMRCAASTGAARQLVERGIREAQGALDRRVATLYGLDEAAVSRIRATVGR